jgi:hypothetical protein
MGIHEDAYAHPELAAAIAAKDCHEIARVLSIGRTKRALVPLDQVQELMQRTGAWWSIRAAAADPANAAHAAAVAVVDVAGSRFVNLDTSLPLVTQMLGDLVTASVMPQAVLDQIMAMGIVPDPLTQREVAVALYTDDGQVI